MTLVKKPVEDFRNLNTDPITKFAEKEKERRENYRGKVFGTILFLLMLIAAVLLGQCNNL